MAEYALYANPRIVEDAATDASQGKVVWDPVKSIWWFAMLLGWIVPGTAYFSLEALLVFVLTSAITLCGGHSLGMHRKLIHDSFNCPLWLEKLGVYLGTLVGLGGPFTMMLTHDMRDWAQRQARCHDYYTHGQGLIRDSWWQIHCKLELERPPMFAYPRRLTTSRFYRWLERTAMWQQLPWAVLLWAIGDVGWVAWGICARVAVSITGHWFVGYFAHNRGPRSWHIEGAAVQGYNVPLCGLITFGECWHNNHHAFPGSAKLGLERSQTDPGWWVLKGLAAIGLVSGLRLPADLPARPELKEI